jgi:hypothetical protein
MRPLRFASSGKPDLGKIRLCRLPKGSKLFVIGRDKDEKLFEMEVVSIEDVAIFCREGFLDCA